MADESDRTESEPRTWSSRMPAHLRPSRGLWVRLTVAVALVVVASLTNRSFLGWGLFVTFAILIVPTGRARSFLFSFVPYAGVWFVFTALRSLADETILARTLRLKVGELERWLFGGQLPSIMLQDRFFDPDNLRWWDYAATAVHWSYFIVPHAVAIRVWYKHPSLYRQYLSAMTLTLGVGLFIYFLIPSNPPWMMREATETPAAATVIRVMTDIGESLGGGLYNASYRVIGESNPIAAMPSIHMAITFLVVFPAFHASKTWGFVALAYSAAMGLSLMYLGEHYFIDVLVGSLVTTYAWVASGTWLRRVAPAMTTSLASKQPQPQAVTEAQPG